MVQGNVCARVGVSAKDEVSVDGRDGPEGVHRATANDALHKLIAAATTLNTVGKLAKPRRRGIRARMQVSVAKPCLTHGMMVGGAAPLLTATTANRSSHSTMVITPANTKLTGLNGSAGDHSFGSEGVQDSTIEITPANVKLTCLNGLEGDHPCGSEGA